MQPVSENGGDTQRGVIRFSPDAYDGEPFIPTHEWQPIKPGQAIPQGLHVYMDMTTGGGGGGGGGGGD